MSALDSAGCRTRARALLNFLSNNPLPRAFSLRHEFSNAFNRLLHSAVDTPINVKIEEKLEQYSAWIPQVFTSQPTSDLAGTLCLQREGATAAVSYLNGGASWVPIAAGPTTTSSASIILGASSGTDRFIHQGVKIAWDEFRINTGTMSCPNLAWEDDSPDWQATPA